MLHVNLTLAGLVALVSAAPPETPAGLQPWQPAPLDDDEPVEGPLPGTDAAAVNNPAVAAGQATANQTSAASPPAPEDDEPISGALPGTDAASVNNPAIAAGEKMDPLGPAGFKAWEVGGIGGLFDIGADPRTDLPMSPWQMWMNGAIFTRWRVLGQHRTWDMALRPEFFSSTPSSSASPGSSPTDSQVDDRPDDLVRPASLPPHALAREPDGASVVVTSSKRGCARNAASCRCRRAAWRSVSSRP